MNYWFVTALCLIVSALQAAPVRSPPLDLEDRHGLEWALNDDPVATLPWAKKQFEQLDKEKDPKRWVRALWFYAALVEEWKEIPGIRALVEEGAIIAEREQMHEEFLAFRGFLPGIITEETQGINAKSEDSGQTEAGYQSMIAEAKRLGVQRVEADAMASYAFYLRDLGETNRSLQLLLDANKLLAEDPKATDLNRMSMKNNLALAFSYQVQKDKALALYQEIDGYCSRVRLRSFCVTNDYNLGKLLLDDDDLKTVAKSEAYFLKSLKSAEEIKERWSVATAHSGLITFHTRFKNYDKAVREAEHAIQLFTDIRNDVWLADSYKKGAKALIGARRFQEALEFIKLARETFPPDFRPDFDDLEDLSYQAWRGLGDTGRALEHLEKHNTEFKKIAKDREKSDYSKLMVGMGLQIEEEKNKVLSIDNELKNQKLRETERLRLFMLVMLGLSLLVMGSMVLAVMRSHEVKVSRMKMQRILDNIEEGILTINSQLQVESEYSRYLQVLLGSQENMTGREALPLLLEKTTLNVEDRSMIHETLRASLGEDELQWFANEQHLPSELIYPEARGTRIVAVHWQPLFDKNQRVQ
ncbi:MAG: hypothetical protein M3Q07_24265, partial [Pseudobdellovibrionaceae bacterium]|nr:hypothetical protein [Pseudobdellovibrionaceae bacterium]